MRISFHVHVDREGILLSKASFPLAPLPKCYLYCVVISDILCPFIDCLIRSRKGPSSENTFTGLTGGELCLMEVDEGCELADLDSESMTLEV